MKITRERLNQIIEKETSSYLKEQRGLTLKQQIEPIIQHLTPLSQEMNKEFSFQSSMIMDEYISEVRKVLETYKGMKVSTQRGDKEWVLQGLYGVERFDNRLPRFSIYARLMYQDRKYGEKTLKVEFGGIMRNMNVEVLNGRPENQFIQGDFTDWGG